MSDEGDRTRKSRTLAHALRHRPDVYGLTIEPGGWATLHTVLTALELTAEELSAIVDAPGRSRFEVAGDRIRARHGHSIAFDSDHPAEVPPATLFHGTVAAKLSGIRTHGLLPLQRRHVHLTSARDEAIMIGARRGAPLIIQVRALALHEEHATPFLRVAGSTIWLVAHVPADYLVLP